MKAARLYGTRDVRVEDVPAPSDLLGGEILIRPRLSGICGTDLSEYRYGPVISSGPHPLTGAGLPQIPGHEFCGDVVAVGDGVRQVAVGDRVAIMPLIFCGSCTPCRQGREQSCSRLGAIGFNWAWGGMAELAVVAEHQVAILPDGVSDVQGAMIEPAAVAVHAVAGAPVVPGDAVLVLGAGPIGQLVGLAARAAGASAVVVLEPNAARRERAGALGFSAVLDPSSLDERARIDDFPEGVDVAMECSGAPAALRTCLEAVRPGGRIVQTALPHADVEIDVRKLTAKDLTITGRNAYPITFWPRVIRLVASGALPVERVVTKTVDLDDIVNDGFERLLDPQGDDVKILVAPS